MRKEGFEIVIYSTRCWSDNGIAEIRKWLKKHKIKIDGIYAEKPIAMMYVDDRAVPFNGNCKTLMRDIHNFKPWTKKINKRCAYCDTPFIDRYVNKRIYCSDECRIKSGNEKKAELMKNYRNGF